MKSISPDPGPGHDFAEGPGSIARQRQRQRQKPGPLGRAASLVFALVFIGVGVALCFMPLFNILGYESSLVLALLGSIAGIRQGVRVVFLSRMRTKNARRSADRDRAGRLHEVFGLFLRGLFFTEVLLLLPLGLLLLNGLRVRNCNYLSGFGFFAMMPMLSAACAVAVGVIAGLYAKTPWRALVFGYTVLGLSIAWSLLRFLATPAIFAYDPFFGYFPGALYDEEVAITRAFFAARALHLLAVGTALVLAAALFDAENSDGEPRLRMRPIRLHRRLFVLGLFLAALSAALYLNGGRLGIYADRATLNRHLYLEQRSASGHFVLRYRPGGPVARDLPRLLREHELRYSELHDLLGVEPDWRPHWLGRLLGLSASSGEITSYLFDSAEEKRRWMGAGHTYIAKPWRREIYLHYEPWPYPVLRHELAHVFAGAAGDRLLRMATRYGLPQPGMIEGLAVAADWRSMGDLDGHQVVLAMRRAQLEPPLAAVFGQGFSGLGFWQLPAGRAYAVAGSFCRYVLERYGAAPLLSVYQRGGRPTDFAAALEVPFSRLEADWRQFIEEQPLKQDSLEVARERMRKKAVFHKVCAHELALRKQAVHAALSHGDATLAAKLLAAVCHDDPDEPQHLSELMELHFELKQLKEAEAAAVALLAHPQRTPALEARAQARLGDLSVLRGDLETGRAYYQRAAAGPESESAARLTTAKLIALSKERAGPLLLRVLVGDQPQNPALQVAPEPHLREPNDAVYVYTLLEAAAVEPTLGLTHYILGRILYERGGYAEAEKELARSQELGLPDGRFEEQALLLRGQAALLAAQPAAAETLFQTLLERLPKESQGKRLDAEDMRERAHRFAQMEGKS